MVEITLPLRMHLYASFDPRKKFIVDDGGS